MIKISDRVRIATGTPRTKFGVITGETKDKRKWIIVREGLIHPLKIHKALVEKVDERLKRAT